MIDVVEKLISYHDFITAVKNIAKFDVQLSRLGYLKSIKLDN